MVLNRIPIYVEKNLFHWVIPEIDPREGTNPSLFWESSSSSQPTIKCYFKLMTTKKEQLFAEQTKYVYDTIPLMWKLLNREGSQVDREIFFIRLREMHPQLAAITIEECLWKYHQENDLLDD